MIVGKGERRKIQKEKNNVLQSFCTETDPWMYLPKNGKLNLVENCPLIYDMCGL